jgi:hypothetical protein
MNLFGKRSKVILTGLIKDDILLVLIAGWSSLVARWAHNPKVAGSNPAPATSLGGCKRSPNFFGGVAQLVRASES